MRSFKKKLPPVREAAQYKHQAGINLQDETSLWKKTNALHLKLSRSNAATLYILQKSSRQQLMF